MILNLQFILEAILLGITLSFLMGPIFFSLLQTSVKKGFKCGIAFSAGVLSSDFLIIILCYLGFSKIFQVPEFSFAFAIIGGIGLISYGLYEILSKENKIKNENVENSGLLKSYLKAFFLNLLSPYVYMFWLGIMGFVTTKYSATLQNIITFFLITLGTVFTFDIIKAFTANKIKNYLNQKVLSIIRKIIGTIILAFGMIIIIRAFVYSQVKIF